MPTMPTTRTMPIPHPRTTVPAPRRHTVRHRHRTTIHQHKKQRKNDTTTIPTSMRLRPTTGHIRLPLATIRQIPRPRTHNTNRARENHATPLNARYTTQFLHTDTKTNTTGNTTTMNVKVKNSHPQPSYPTRPTKTTSATTSQPHHASKSPPASTDTTQE